MGNESSIERQRNQYGLMMLRLIRQLPRENSVRKDAEKLLCDTEFISLESVLRGDEREAMLREVGAEGRRCQRCDALMYHTRRFGWQCSNHCAP